MITGRLAFLAPMPSELRPLVKALSLRRAPGEGDPPTYVGTLGDDDVVATLTGIGVERAARRAEAVVIEHEPDHLLVIGVAGALGSDITIGDVVVPDVVIDVADGAEFRPHAAAATAGGGTLYTSGDFLTDRDVLAGLRAAGGTAIDMETAAIARVCSARGCAWTVYRGISDDAFDPTVDERILALARPDGSADLGAVARFVAADPRRVRLLARLGRGLTAATTAAVTAALAACEGGLGGPGGPGGTGGSGSA